jgi:hypothetical protein
MAINDLLMPVLLVTGAGDFLVLLYETERRG